MLGRRFHPRCLMIINIVLSTILKCLIPLPQNKFYVLPTIYLRSDLDKVLRDKLREMVKRHQGNLCGSEAEATHVVYGMRKNPWEEELVRPVMKRESGGGGSGALLHWIGWPDSYDTWVDTPNSLFIGFEGTNCDYLLMESV